MAITTSEAPISAAMAAHSEAVPANVSTTNTALTINARAMFCRITAQGPPRVPDQPGELGQVVRHQGDVGGFDGRIAAGGPHRDPHRRPSQGRGIVHAVADHRHVAVAVDQLADPLDLVVAAAVRRRPRHSRLGGNRACRPFVVAGQHHHVLDVQRAEFGQQLPGRRTESVDEANGAADVLAVADHDDRMPFGLQGEQLLVDLGGFLAALLQIAMRADPIQLAAELALGPLAGKIWNFSTLSSSRLRSRAAAKIARASG